MGGLFGDPWSPSNVVEPGLLKVGAPANDQDLSGDEAIIAYINTVASGLQPHDSDLDAIAALATTGFGRGFLALVDQAAAQAYIGASGGPLTDGDYGDIVVSGTGTVLNIDSAVLSTFARTLIDDASAAAAQATLGLVPGTNVQAFDSDLAAIAALATTSFGRSLLALADAAALRSAAGLVIGTDVQAFDSDLASIAALSTTSFGRGLLALADAAALRLAAGLVIGTDVQAHDADLDAIAALTTTAYGRSLLTAANAAGLQTLAGLAAIATSGSASDLSAGTVPAARMPAHTGDVTSSAGSVALTFSAATVVAKIAGQALAPASIAATGAITSSSASAGIGYATGAGGAVTQLTSKSTAVTINTLSGQITMNGATLNSGTPVSFTMNNSQLAVGDRLILNIEGNAATLANYNLQGGVTGAGTAVIGIRNLGAGALSEALKIGFVVIKAANA